MMVPSDVNRHLHKIIFQRTFVDIIERLGARSSACAHINLRSSSSSGAFLRRILSGITWAFRYRIDHALDSIVSIDIVLSRHHQTSVELHTLKNAGCCRRMCAMRKPCDATPLLSTSLASAVMIFFCSIRSFSIWRATTRLELLVVFLEIALHVIYLEMRGNAHLNSVFSNGFWYIVTLRPAQISLTEI